MLCSHLQMPALMAPSAWKGPAGSCHQAAHQPRSATRPQAAAPSCWSQMAPPARLDPPQACVTPVTASVSAAARSHMHTSNGLLHPARDCAAHNSNRPAATDLPTQCVCLPTDHCKGISCPSGPCIASRQCNPLNKTCSVDYLPNDTPCSTGSGAQGSCVYGVCEPKGVLAGARKHNAVMHAARHLRAVRHILCAVAAFP